MQILNGRRRQVAELAFSPCGRWLAAAGRGQLHVWDTANPTGTPRHFKTSWHFPVHIRGFRSDGRLCFLYHFGAWYQSAATGNEYSQIEQLQGGLAISPDGTRVVCQVQVASGRLQCWAIDPDENPVAEAKLTGGRSCRFAVFSPGGSLLATFEVGSSEPFLVFRSADTLEQTTEVLGIYRAPTGILFSPDGAHLVVCSAGSLAVWNVVEPTKAPRKTTNPTRKHFLSMAFHPEGRS